ncbi:S8 family serine peptidase [uncultured Sphaerochaeta sp.]|uniref:S8 family serine peptidase n=1 Tax=uncultured Sphaerochaeta sp. TaxID=886478 RepID=UPI002A0A1470|nr:S8 family serine peptidase [uncultured Sphaerochaeta sp.]
MSVFLFILAGCSSSIENTSSYTVSASWNSYVAGAGLETVEESSTATSKISSSSSTASIQIAGQVTKYVTEAGTFGTDSPTRFIVGYTHEPNKQLFEARLEDIHAMEDLFMGGMSIERKDRGMDHPMTKSAPFDTFHIPSEVLESYGNDYERIVNAMNENFFSNGGTGDEVAYVEPDYSMQAFSVGPDDPFYPEQWNMQNSYMNIPKLHSITSGDSGVVVAVIDTGVYEDGEDFEADTFVMGYNFCTSTSTEPTSPGVTNTTDSTDTTDDNGHGTHVTGTIAETTDNGLGVASIAPGVKIMPLKALDSEGSGYTSDICDAIRYAVDNGVNIINLSLGSTLPSTTLESACTYAKDNGVLIVAAAGNDDSSEETYPAAYDSVLSVGAVGYDTSTRASYSNYGAWVDVTAFGGEDDYFTDNGTQYYEGILQWTISTTSTNGYYYYIGTSMATPHVTALAALLLSEDSSRTPETLTDIICKTATEYDSTSAPYEMGKYGIVDALAAMQYTAAQTVSDTVSVSITDDETQSSSWTLSSSEGNISVSLDSDDIAALSMTLSDEAGTIVASADGSKATDDENTLSLSYTLDSSDADGIYTLTVTYAGTTTRS